jgi:hypothetical protein
LKFEYSYCFNPIGSLKAQNGQRNLYGLQKKEKREGEGFLIYAFYAFIARNK